MTGTLVSKTRRGLLLTEQRTQPFLRQASLTRRLAEAKPTHARKQLFSLTFLMFA